MHFTQQVTKQELAFQFEQNSIYASLFFSTFIIIPLDQIFGIINNLISRKNEYEADSYSAQKYGHPDKLISALKSLSRSNLSNLNPHPVKVFTEYSHPPLKDRIKALQQISH